MITAINKTQSNQPNFQRWSSKPYTQRVVKAMEDKLMDEGITKENNPAFYDAFNVLSGIKSKVFGPALLTNKFTPIASLTDKPSLCHMQIWMDDFERSDAYQARFAEKIVEPQRQGDYTAFYSGMQPAQLTCELIEDDYSLGNALFEAINNISTSILSEIKDKFANEVATKA